MLHVGKQGVKQTNKKPLSCEGLVTLPSVLRLGLSPSCGTSTSGISEEIPH